MIRKFVYLFVVYIIVVNGQNIFFDCKQGIISDVIRSDFQKTKVFLETGQNSLVVEPPLNGEITEETNIPVLNSDSFWRLNASFSVIAIDFTQFNTGGIYYAITGIAIENVNSTQCQFENIINSNSYTLTYKVDGSLYQVNWFGSTGISSIPPLLKSNISPITVQELFIERNITVGYQYCMQYEIYGCPIGTNSITLTTVPVLSYDLSNQPLSDTNRDYTGVCRDGTCYGGVGILNSGVIGEITDLNLSNQTKFTVWKGISSLKVSFKLSNYFYITSVIVYSVLLPTNAFDQSGALINQQNYSVSINKIEINNIVQTVCFSIQSNSTDFLAITEIEIFDENNANIQDYYKTPFQPLACDDQMTSSNVTVQPTTVSLTERKELEYFILIVTVGVLGMLLLLMMLVLIMLVCGIIVISKGKHISDKRIENAIKSNIHASTMSIAQNRIASYADVNDADIKNLRERIRSRVMSEEYIEMEKLEKELSNVEKLISSETDDQVFSKLFKIKEDNEGYTVMTGARKDKFPDESDHYDEVYRSSK